MYISGNVQTIGVSVTNFYRQERKMPKHKIGWYLTEDELQALHTAQGGLEWAAAKNKVLDARGGEFPPDWFEEVIASGLVETKIAAYGRSHVADSYWDHQSSGPERLTQTTCRTSCEVPQDESRSKLGQ